MCFFVIVGVCSFFLVNFFLFFILLLFVYCFCCCVCLLPLNSELCAIGRKEGNVLFNETHNTFYFTVIWRRTYDKGPLS